MKVSKVQGSWLSAEKLLVTWFGTLPRINAGMDSVSKITFGSGKKFLIASMEWRG